MNSWIPTTNFRRLSGSVFSGYTRSSNSSRASDSEVNGSVSEHEPEQETSRTPSPEQTEVIDTMNNSLRRRRESTQQRKEQERPEEEEERREEIEVRRRGSEDEFSDIPCQDVSPPTREKSDDVIQELELIHFLLTELNQRKDKKASVKELLGYLTIFYSNLITFIRNRDEPLTCKFSPREKKMVRENFDEKFLQVIDEYIKSNLFGLSSDREDLYLTTDTISRYYEFKDQLCKRLEAELRSKIVDMLKAANSCLSLDQIIEGVKKSHQYLVCLRLRTIRAVRDFLLNHPNDFTLVNEMVSSAKGSSMFEDTPPIVEEVPQERQLLISVPKCCLKRSVSFADPSFLTPPSCNVSKSQSSSAESVSQNSRTAFALETKIVESQMSTTSHGSKCVCDKLSLYKFASRLREEDFMQMNLKCLIASYMKAVDDLNKKPSIFQHSFQTTIPFDSNENLS